MNRLIVGDRMFKKIKLNYSSLEPVISDLNLDIHYNKHYGKYVDNLNKLLPNYEDSVESILENIDSFDKKERGSILVNAGGIVNHELYFRSMSNKPSTNNILVDDIVKQYGSIDNFKTEFINSANKLVGSGYTFLVYKDSKFDIINLPNQENPYSYNYVPLIALDLWEHAYYLTYYNDRALYINNFFTIINFDYADTIYEKIKQK